MAKQIPIGNDVYLFTHNDGPSDYLLISSHGLHIPKSKFVAPNSSTINFYAPSRQFLIMTIDQFNMGTNVAEQVRGGSSCQNYALSKWQAGHGGGKKEDYIALKNHIDTTRKKIADAPRDLARYRNMGMKDKVRDTENLIPFDFLTIRNRKKVGVLRGNTLKSVLNDLSKSGYNYPNIFCSFCRGMVPFYDSTHEAGKS